MELIKGIPYQTFTRDPYEKMTHPPMPEGEGPGGPGGPGEGPGPMPGMPESWPEFAALEVKNGKVIARDEALTAEVSDTEAKNVVLNINRKDMGGIYVSGEGSDFTVEHANIRISGEGQGLGGKLSGAAVEDHATLTLKDCRINMDGKLRCATSAGGNSVLKVYDSMLISHGDPWPVDEKEVTWIIGPGMAKPPVFLEIEGNMRTHCTVQNSETYFYNSTIIADSWAALSTDAGGDRVYLEANDCNVITTRSGYGTYADTSCYCTLNRCNLDVQNMAAIVAGESGVVLNDCTGKCGSYVVLNHVVGGGPGNGIFTQVSDIKITGGQYQCVEPAVICKSCNADVLFENTRIDSFCGVLLKSRLNDDPCAPNAEGREVYGLHVILRDMDTTNSILHEDPTRRMTVKMENSKLTGAIAGNVMLTIDEKSLWTATADSAVVLNGDVPAGTIDALPGVTITAVGAEDKEYTLASGGKLVVTAK